MQSGTSTPDIADQALVAQRFFFLQCFFALAAERLCFFFLHLD